MVRRLNGFAMGWLLFTIAAVVLSGCTASGTCSAPSRELMVEGRKVCWAPCPGDIGGWCAPGYMASVDDGGDVVIAPVSLDVHETGIDGSNRVDAMIDAADAFVDGVDGADCSRSTMGCDPSCENTQTDPNNCGRCGNRCPGGSMGIVTCTAGVCGFSCPIGQHVCGLSCEADDSVTGCGIMCERCVAPVMNAVPICAAGMCDWSCAPGYERVGMGCELKSPRLLGPMSTSYVTSQRPTLRWELPMGLDGARIEICTQRACGAGQIESIDDVMGSTFRPMRALGPGVHFWRAYGRRGDALGSRSSATWEFFVGHRDAPIDTSWGSVLDVNGDGYADVAAGDPTYAAMGVANTGRVLLWTGGAMGLAAQPAQIDAPETGGRFGTVESAGDVNGDGFGDMLVGASNLSVGGVNFAGKAWLFLGGAGGLRAMPSWESSRPVFGAFGGSLSFLGDVNRDGFGDVAIGALFETDGGTPTTGAVYVFRGNQTGLEPMFAQRLTGPSEELGLFGNTVRSAGDINGDQLPDLLVGTPRRLTSATRRVGRAFVLLGDGMLFSPLPNRVYEGTTILDSYGLGAVCVGDINGDGRTDIAIPAPNADRAPLIACGIVDVVFGAAMLPRSPDFTISGQRDDEHLSAVSGTDLDADGYGDLIVGTTYEPQFMRTGIVRWLRGSAMGLQAGSSLRGVAINGQFGASISAVGDVNRDGIAELFVSAPDALVGALTGAGVAHQLSYRAGNLEFIRSLAGQRSMQQFGQTNSSY